MNTKKKSNTIITVVLIVVIVVIAALIIVQHTIGLDALFGKSSSQAGGMPFAAAGMRGSQSVSATNVEVLEITRSDYIHTTAINGELEIKDSSRTVSAEASGTITEILVSRGDAVNAGDVIARIDPSTPGNQYKVRDVKSAVSGTVLSVDAYVGQTASQNTTLITVGNPSSLILKLNVPEKYLANLVIGADATFTTAAWPDHTYNAQVSWIGNSVNKSTRTVEAELTITNPDSRLMAGMFVRARLVTEKHENVFVVPNDALTTYLGNDMVYVVRDNRSYRTPVVKGASDNNQTIIKEGLSEGDLVVIKGSASDSAPVNIVNEGV